MSTLSKLKAAQSLSDVAKLLGYQPSSLAYVLYKIPIEKKYTAFEIPKKDGGKRKITAPDPKLKNLQRSLARLLSECRDEIQKSGPKRKSLSHGFKKGHSILTNSRPHVRRRYVLNLDLKDFFPSLNFGRIRGYFIKNNDFKLSENAATVLAQIACYKNALPQGSPCSPIISDCLAHILDVRLARLARDWGCTYSRYADDLTFSTNRKTFPTAIARPIKAQPMKWKAGPELEKQIKNSDFEINSQKTRMQYSISRQTVTGLVVNRKANIKSEYYRLARSMCHSLFKEGKYDYKGAVGKADIGPLQGRLSHIHFVKFSEMKRASEPQLPAANNKNSKDNKLVGWQKLYGRFLFYKNFVALERPLVICEGPTDSIYLRSAIQSLGANYPTLTTVKGGKRVLGISFFKYGEHSERLLRLGGGSDKIKNFISTYPEELKYFGHAPMKFPVIVLIDNDQGAGEIFSLMNSKFKSQVSLTTKLHSYPVCANLILVKTPELGPTGDSKIENFFAQEVLDVKLNGKVFNAAKKIDPTKEYGKTPFAENVVIPNKNKIDFSKFAPLLERISLAITSYKPPP